MELRGQGGDAQRSLP